MLLVFSIVFFPRLQREDNFTIEKIDRKLKSKFFPYHKVPEGHRLELFTWCIKTIYSTQVSTDFGGNKEEFLPHNDNREYGFPHFKPHVIGSSGCD